MTVENYKKLMLYIIHTISMLVKMCFNMQMF